MCDRTECDKAAIERRFTLRDKLKKIIPQLLENGSPVDESLWYGLSNDIGHDEIMASLMSEAEFDSFHRSLFNWS